MKLRTLIMASSVLGLLNISASFSADNFFSLCEGSQRTADGHELEITLKFKPGSDGGYVGSAEYYNPINMAKFGGKLKNISVTPQKVNFDMIYVGGRADGNTVKMSLKRFKNELRGTGYSDYSDRTLDIEVACN